MSFKINRAPLLYYIKFCASFEGHLWVQSRVTDWKYSMWIKQAIIHYLIQWWPSLLLHICITWHEWINKSNSQSHFLPHTRHLLLCFNMWIVEYHSWISRKNHCVIMIESIKSFLLIYNLHNLANIGQYINCSLPNYCFHQTIYHHFTVLHLFSQISVTEQNTCEQIYQFHCKFLSKWISCFLHSIRLTKTMHDTWLEQLFSAAAIIEYSSISLSADLLLDPTGA